MKSSLIAAAVATAMLASSAAAQTALVSEDIMVKSPDAGIELFVRNKRPANMTSFRPERTVLFVHGATYPAHTAFDLKLGGTSWMEYIASRGYDVYLVDLRGYGKSTRPKEMADKPEANPPLVRGDVAVKDIGTVVDFIRARSSRASRCSAGHGAPDDRDLHDAERRQGRTARPVCAVWIRQTPSLVQTAPARRQPPYGATLAGARPLAHRRPGQEGRSDSGRLVRCLGRCDVRDRPGRPEDEPPRAARANGVVRTGSTTGGSEGLLRSGKDHRADLLVLGEWDRDTPPYMAQTLFPLLTNAPGKRFVMLAEGTHTIIMEKNRMKLFEAVQSFLDEAGGS